MYFLLNFIGNDGFEDIAVNVANLEKLLYLASNILDCSPQNISCFLFVDGTLIDENNYLETLSVWTQLLVCKPCQKEKLLVYFDIKRAIDAGCL